MVTIRGLQPDPGHDEAQRGGQAERRAGRGQAHGHRGEHAQGVVLEPLPAAPRPGAGRPADSAPPKCLTLDSNAGPLPSATARGQPKGPYRTRTHSTGEWKSTG